MNQSALIGLCRGHLYKPPSFSFRSRESSHAVSILYSGRPHEMKSSFYGKVVRWIKIGLRAVYFAIIWTPCLCAAPIAYFFESTRDRWFHLLTSTIRWSGPLALKCAQWISTRRDIFPLSITERLAVFQTASPDHSWLTTCRIICSSLGLTQLNDCFLGITKDSVGSGSVGQVHAALLRNPDGGPPLHVAVKVIHPSARRWMDADVGVLLGAARFAAWFVPALHFLDVEGALREFGRSMQTSLNLENEAKNLERFSKLFSADDVHFPGPIMSTRDVLVMSFEEGEPLKTLMDATSDDTRKKKVARTGIRLFAEMIAHNFVHGDIHPGNVLVRGSDIVILDCGLAVELSPRNRDNFHALLVSMVLGDPRLSARLILRNSVGSKTDVDEEAFAADIDAVFKRYVVAKSFATSDLVAALSAVLATVQRHGVRLESAFVNLITSSIVLEGVGKSLDPSLSLFSVFKEAGAVSVQAHL